MHTKNIKIFPNIYACSLSIKWWVVHLIGFCDLECLSFHSVLMDAQGFAISTEVFPPPLSLPRSLWIWWNYPIFAPMLYGSRVSFPSCIYLNHVDMSEVSNYIQLRIPWRWLWTVGSTCSTSIKYPYARETIPIMVGRHLQYSKSRTPSICFKLADWLLESYESDHSRVHECAHQWHACACTHTHGATFFLMSLWHLLSEWYSHGSCEQLLKQCNYGGMLPCFRNGAQRWGSCAEVPRDAFMLGKESTAEMAVFNSLSETVYKLGRNREPKM